MQSYDPDIRRCVRTVLPNLTISQSYDPCTRRCLTKVLQILTILKSYDTDTRRCVRKVLQNLTILQSYCTKQIEGAVGKSNAQEANTNLKKEIDARTHFNKISNGSITKQTREFSANSFLQSD